MEEKGADMGGAGGEGGGANMGGAGGEWLISLLFVQAYPHLWCCVDHLLLRD